MLVHGMACEWTAWLELVEERRKILQKNLKYSGDLAKGSSEMQLNGAREDEAGNAVSTELKKKSTCV